jgi:hypothetical protein
MGRGEKSGRIAVRARRLLPVPVNALRLFLSEARNQILVAESAVYVPDDLGPVALPTSVRLRAPRGLRRRVRLIALQRENAGVSLLASIGRRTEIRIRWSLQEIRAVTGVEIALEFERRGVAVRAFMLLGGGRWLERRLEAALESLGEIAQLAAAGGALDEADACHVALTAYAVQRKQENRRRPADGDSLAPSRCRPALSAT